MNQNYSEMTIPMSQHKMGFPVQPHTWQQQIDLSKRVKKDALWKPLLRNFRIYLRRSLQIFLVQMTNIYDAEGELVPSAQLACKKFIKSIGASERA